MPIHHTSSAQLRALQTRGCLLPMIILIDYHSGQLADAIAAKDHLALVSIRNHGAASNVRTGWKHLLELEFDDDARVDWAGSGMAAAQADLIVDFCSWLGSSTEPIGLILRCDHGRRRSAAVSKALGEWCDLWVENPGLRYSRPAYQTMRRRIGTLTPPATAKFGGAGWQRVAMRVAH